MTIEAKKLELMSLLLKTQNESILTKLKTVFEEEKDRVDWWDEISEEEREDIKTGLKQADNEDYITDETVMKRFNKWH